MKKVEVLAIGTELLMGQVANTDAQHISEKCPEVGLGVYYHTVVGDNPGRLTDCLKIALSRADVVVTTGGLGPTQDDLSKETVASCIGRRMVFNKEYAAVLERYFTKMGRKMSENNLRQAYFPEGSELVPNDWGTAPGCTVKFEYEGAEKVIVMLPGPPKELYPMFDKYVLPFFASESGNRLCTRFVRSFGIGESDVETMLMDLIDGQTNPTVATYVKDGVVSVRVTGCDEDGKSAEEITEETVSKITGILGECVFSVKGEELNQVACDALRKNGLTLSCTEIGTGGAFVSALTETGNTEDIFAGGITVENGEKIVGILGEKCDTIKDIAESTRNLFASDISAVIICDGFSGFSEVFILKGDKYFTREFIFQGSRSKIAGRAAKSGLDMLRRFLKDENSFNE